MASRLVWIGNINFKLPKLFAIGNVQIIWQFLSNLKFRSLPPWRYSDFFNQPPPLYDVFNQVLSPLYHRESKRNCELAFFNISYYKMKPPCIVNGSEVSYCRMRAKVERPHLNLLLSICAWTKGYCNGKLNVLRFVVLFLWFDQR